MGREPVIETSSTRGNTTAGVQAAKHGGRWWRKSTVLWVITASTGLFVFAVGLFTVANSIHDDPEMYFFVKGDRGQPLLSGFPAEGGLFCEPLPFILSTCAVVDVKEFNPPLPTFARNQSYEVWLVATNEGPGCRAIAIRVEGKQYTTPEFGWLAPLDATTPWALLLGFVGTVAATYKFVQRKVRVLIPVVLLPILFVLVYLSSHPFFGQC